MVWREILREEWVTKKFTKKCGKNDHIWPEITSKTVNFAQMTQDFYKYQSNYGPY